MHDSARHTAAAEGTPHVKIGLWDYVGTTPPPFGHPMRQFWSFDPKYINLNHGAPLSYAARTRCPR